MSEIWRWSNLLVAFAMELAGYAAFAWWGWEAGSSTALRLVLAVGLPLIAAVVWRLFAAHANAKYGNPVVKAIVKVAFFGLAGLAVWTLGHPVLAVVFVLVVAANLLIIRTGDLTAGVAH
ncbi:YrdB family protein [Kribbella sp. CA-294648]|uniref:YrdB family protein n=1 Tax=Kribbella sp. CA-294648 TaxID=3239948 RepID=UPI003D8F46CD